MLIVGRDKRARCLAGTNLRAVDMIRASYATRDEAAPDTFDCIEAARNRANSGVPWVVNGVIERGRYRRYL